ncbi:hypothetical protein RND81_08G186800 [Saponaria officinalis]|uniref:KIB1-4 beta-propeller domain-containing protein n=1 Tax=Saponaria officinalis TaxID=3572 RepID=A0AAW1J901_SAPOF
MDEDMYTPPNASEAPWLIATHENNRKIEKQTFCTMSPNIKSYVKKIVDLDGQYIVASISEWLVLQERKNRAIYSLWNPVTLKKIILPELVKAPKGQPLCVFTSSPSDNNTSSSNKDCVLLMFFTGLVFFCKPFTKDDDGKWLKQSLKYNDTKVYIYSVASIDGDVYLVGSSNIFARVKITDDVSNPLIFEPSFFELPNMINLSVYDCYFAKMVEIDGILHYVLLNTRQTDITGNFDIFMVFIWKLDLSRMEWNRVKSLGNRALLIDPHSSTWCWTSTSTFIEGDCIYLVDHDYETLHLYRLRDNSYTNLLPHCNFRWMVGCPSWFLPNHTRFWTDEEEEKTDNVEKSTMNVKEMKKEIDMKMSRNALSELPEDILTTIANRLHWFDYMNFRKFCKIIDISIPPLKWRDDCSFRWLISFKTNIGVFELWDPFEKRHHTINTPYSPDVQTTIDFCKDGWLLSRVGRTSLHYWNPFTEETGEYPHFTDTGCNDSYAFSTCPNSLDCLTVGMFGYFGASVNCFQAASKQWDQKFFEYSSDKVNEYGGNHNSSGRYYHGAFYFIVLNGSLGVFKRIGEEMIWEVYDCPLDEEARSTLNLTYLVEFNGQLASIFFQQDGKKVQVFTFDIVENSWVEIYDLGEHVLFVSPASSFSRVENDCTKRNRIYLPFRMGDDIVYYSLTTCKYHAFGREETMDDFYGMNIPQICCWI